MNNNKRTIGIQILLAAILLVHLVLFAQMWTQLFAQPALGGVDFISFYTAGRIAQSIGSSHLYDLDQQRSIQQDILITNHAPGAMLPYMHPPFLVPLLQVITTDDYKGSYIRWTLVLLLVMVFCSVVVYRFLRQDSGFSLSDSLVTAVASILFFPIFISLLKGQDTVFMLLGALLWMRAVLQKNDGLAGASLGLIALKPHIAIVLAIPTIFARRQALWSFCLTATLTALFCLVLVRWQGLLDFISLMRITAQGEGYGVNQVEMYNFIGLMLRAVPQADPEIVRMLSWGLYVLTIGALCWFYRDKKQLQVRDLGLAVILSLFTSPHLHFHDLSLLVVPALGLATTVVKESSWGCAAAPALLVVISSILLFGLLMQGSISYLIVYAIMIMFCIVFYMSPHLQR